MFLSFNLSFRTFIQVYDFINSLIHSRVAIYLPLKFSDYCCQILLDNSLRTWEYLRNMNKKFVIVRGENTYSKSKLFLTRRKEY